MKQAYKVTYIERWKKELVIEAETPEIALEIAQSGNYEDEANPVQCDYYDYQVYDEVDDLVLEDKVT